MNAESAQVGLATFQSASQLRLDGFFGNSQSNGYLPLGQTMQFAQDDDLTATRRERGNGFGEEPGLFLIGNNINDIGVVVYDGQLVQIPYRINR